MILSGKEVALQSRQSTASSSGRFLARFNRKPSLAVILVGNDPASCVYVAGKKKACEETGIDHKDINLDESTSQEELLDVIRRLNEDPDTDGILVQLPLPSHIDENSVIAAISPEKDVDGFTAVNTGLMLQGQRCFVPCTPKGILRILDHYGISTQSRKVCIIGRSNIVGKPMAALLMQKDRNATVTLCHSATADLRSHTLEADIIIVATGRINTLTADMVKDGVTVIDVGINRIPDATKKSGTALKGDVDFEGVSQKAYAITPVPGGVGPMTIAMLMENTLEAACRSFGTEVGQL